MPVLQLILLVIMVGGGQDKPGSILGWWTGNEDRGAVPTGLLYELVIFCIEGEEDTFSNTVLFHSVGRGCGLRECLGFFYATHILQ